MGSGTIVIAGIDKHKETKAGDNKKYCEHHWEIETAQGPVSMGVCRHCGEKREFHNYLSDCLVDKDKYEDWLAKQGRERPIRKRSVEVI